jgi:bile acid:Na+ symporter, BASS family
MEGSIVTSLLLPAALAVIMFILGLSLTVTDFKRVFVQPRGVAIGLTNLVFVSPLLAFAIAHLYGLPPELAVGLVLLGASPGGTLANLLTHLARGDTALSVTMTATSSMLSLITVPLYLGLAINHFGADILGDIQMSGVVLRILLVVVIPVSAGMAVRARHSDRVERASTALRNVAVGTFALVVVGAVASEHQTVISHILEVGAAALTLNLAAMTISYTVSLLAGLDARQATAIALELGVHNATLAIAVGATLAAALSVPAAVYSVFMFLTGIGFARLMYRRNARLAPAPVAGA